MRIVIPGLVLLALVAWQITGLWPKPDAQSSSWRQQEAAPTAPVIRLGSAQAAEILTPRSDEPPPAPPPAPSAAPQPAAPLQPSPAPAEAAPPSPVAEQAAKPAVDETALRYFARQGDTRRLNTEIARLRSLYPDWVPPDDPLKAPPVSDPQLDSLWQLYSQGQFAAARAAIVARQGRERDWIPPKDLLDRLAVAETRERLVNASNAKQYMTVIELATVTPSLLTCGDVDVLWRLAEAFAQTDRKMRAQDAYRYILTSCTDPHDRLSTMQKAMTLLPRSEIEPLLALGRSGTDGDEFRSIREGLARNAVAAGGADPKLVVDPSDLQLLGDIARTDKSPGDALLLGGYFRGHGDSTQAEQWYRRAFERQNTAAAAEGLALALIDLKRAAEAEAILAPWHDANDGARKSYMAAIANLLAQQPPPALTAEVLARVVAAVAAQRDPAAAQQLGWFAHYYRQEETAARWFAAALSWKPDDEPSAYGLAIANLGMNRRDMVRSVVNAWGQRSLRIRALLDPALARELARTNPQTGPATQAPWTVGMQQPSQPSQFPQAPVLSAPAPQQPVSGGSAPVATMLPGQVPQAMPASQPQVFMPVPQADQGQSIADQPMVTERPARRAPSRPRRTAATPATPAATSAGRGSCPGGVAGGWCLMKLDRPSEAVVVFQAALSAGSAQQRQDAAYGLSLAYLRLGLTSQAAAASTQASQPTGRARELNLSILTQRILKDYQGGRYAQALMALDTRASLAPEQTDLLMLRGWSYFHLQRFAEARRVFEAVAATGNSEAAGAVEAVKEATHSRF
ncbi:cellulose synthase [Labrys sp. LIt4]|uniref:cellulose synthase n=1 Tax=Labrys sp. LIt4 TaxID=2821355 RepID=UPI001ADFC301|nr:cellulose synthase [Labrys sp. LIt4]MBP0582609.1 cellulose synthase [Labrys sp. LIt4]